MLYWCGICWGTNNVCYNDNCPDLEVTLVDIDDKKIAAWNDKNLNNLPIFEPGLKEVVSRNRNKNLFFCDIENSIKNADMVFISLNTPKKKGLEQIQVI